MAMKVQEARIPAAMPITDQYSVKPSAYAAAGRPRRNHADSPDARSEIAATHGPSLRPAST
jgi:hypothetical protein